MIFASDKSLVQQDLLIYAIKIWMLQWLNYKPSQNQMAGEDIDHRIETTINFQSASSTKMPSIHLSLYS